MTIQYSQANWNGKKVILGDTGLKPDGPVHLLLGFHGADSTPENMVVYGNQLDVPHALLVYPEGPVDAGEGVWSWWQDGPRQKEAIPEFLDYASQMIDQARRHLQAAVPNAEVRTSLWGYSQGGAASLVYALLGRHRLHKVASVCGFLPEIPEDLTPNGSPASILGIYGANDPVVPSFLADYAL
ncbi:MAG: phospholipase, partial [Nitrospinaceae bacterium]|nr:phospholipase [Nitrospinaceae bacterium]NIR53489.1 phospholipase [Nitrospinaceae bacterium]NIS83886.1 phospholipase [Nitrospinaceae bacterium]NIT80686.1 phospholipase [Nitrospinaceae bacterium]NIU43005.1 phospholipase [Nitrospinaceae bacterium]